MGVTITTLACSAFNNQSLIVQLN
uniref:Uncharacterized protein n=1 Tax=Rhizophora mucronata TaxID=61149 RepID=A0A2P2QSG3_RHIMU